MRETSLLLCLLLVAEGRNQVSVPPGADASLRCVGPRGATIALLEWVRPDLSPDGYVFFYREEQLYENYLHPQFVGRAELRDPQMRDGDVSVVLKNVTRADAGSYDCFISVSKPGRRRRATPDFSRTVELLVEDAEEGHTAERTGAGGRAHVAFAVSCVAAAALVLGVALKRKAQDSQLLPGDEPQDAQVWFWWSSSTFGSCDVQLLPAPARHQRDQEQFIKSSGP